jgi:hypothetical protein
VKRSEVVYSESSRVLRVLGVLVELIADRETYERYQGGVEGYEGSQEQAESNGRACPAHSTCRIVHRHTNALTRRHAVTRSMFLPPYLPKTPRPAPRASSLTPLTRIRPQRGRSAPRPPPKRPTKKARSPLEMPIVARPPTRLPRPRGRLVRRKRAPRGIWMACHQMGRS